MGHKIRAQIGKTNISGDGNNVTQIGYGNQNNSNNTTHNHYHGNNPTSQSDSGEFLIFGVVTIILIALMNYSLFKYADYVTLAITYAHIVLFLILFAAYNLYKNQDLDKKDVLNIFLISLIGLLSFLCAKELFSIQDFKSLSNYANDKKFLEYWDMPRQWKIKSFYFLFSSISIAILLSINIYFTISFLRYSCGSREQSNFIGVVIILVLAILAYYFIIYDSRILLKFISQILMIK